MRIVNLFWEFYERTWQEKEIRFLRKPKYPVLSKTLGSHINWTISKISRRDSPVTHNAMWRPQDVFTFQINTNNSRINWGIGEV